MATERPSIIETSSSALVLIVDDDAAIRRLIALELEMVGLQAVSASTLQEGLRLASTRRPYAVILDARLPDSDGGALIESISRVTAAPILVLSAIASEENDLRQALPGADDYLPKPFDPAELSKRVLRLLENHQGAGVTGD